MLILCLVNSLLIYFSCKIVSPEIHFAKNMFDLQFCGKKSLIEVTSGVVRKLVLVPRCPFSDLSSEGLVKEK